jgi:hypothetical protein
MSIQLLEQFVNSNSLTVDLADKYLTLYLGESDWPEKITQLWSVQKKKLGEDKAKEFVKKSIACACLSPIVNKSAIPQENHVLLFWVSGWPQFNERDWLSLLKDTIKTDIQIEKNRTLILKEGIFDHIDIPPLTRQAYNWLHERLDKESFSNHDKKEEAITKMKNLIKIYGGAVVCNVFTNYSQHIEKVLNWRSGYFIEKEIHKIYSTEQIIKIKKAEIQKTNSNYIKLIR